MDGGVVGEVESESEGETGIIEKRCLSFVETMERSSGKVTCRAWRQRVFSFRENVRTGFFCFYLFGLMVPFLFFWWTGSIFSFPLLKIPHPNPTKFLISCKETFNSPHQPHSHTPPVPASNPPTPPHVATTS